jgi:hypothetical protein
MSNEKTDLLTLATRYSDRLSSELEKVREFLVMADRLSNAGDDLCFGMTLAHEDDKPLELH